MTMNGVNRRCPLCSEIVGYFESVGTPIFEVLSGEWLYPHRECGLRSVIGGIGHLTDHRLWCVERNDPDGGLSYRESAQAVRAWVDEHGIDAAVAAGQDASTGP